MQPPNLMPERELNPSDSELRALVHTLPVLVSKGRADGGGVDFVNKRFIDYTGLAGAAALGWGWMDAVHPVDRRRVTVCAESILTSGTSQTTEMRLRRFDGTYRWFLFDGSPLHDASGTVVGWNAIKVDVDDRKRAAEALGESVQELRLIIDSIPGHVAILNTSGQAETVNRGLLDYFGRPFEDFQFGDTSDHVHPDDLAGVIAAWVQAMSTGTMVEYEHRLRRFDGVYRWFYARGVPLRDSANQILRWYVLLTDIDDRKRAEELLRAREQQFRAILDSIPGLVALVNATSGEIELVNRGVLDYFGRSLEQLQQWTMSDSVHPDDLPRVIAAWQRAITTGEAPEWEHRLRRSDGVYRWFHLRGFPWRDSNNQLVRWYCLITDIHDRKTAEDALRRSETFLLEVQKLSRTGGWRFDVATGIVESSPEIQRAYKVQPGDDISNPEFWFGRIHADDRLRVRSTFERCVREKCGYRSDYRVVLGDGSIGYQHAIGRPVLNETGELVEFIGASMDMTDHWLAATELERASQALHDMQTKLSRAAQVATVGELAASIAHEVNQPLAAVVTNGHACLRWLSAAPPNIDKAMEAAQRIVTDGKGAGEVVHRVRSLFKRAPVEEVPLDINDIICDVLRLLEADAARRGVALAVSLESDRAPVRGDRVQLQQLVLNLVLNALDALESVADRAKQVSIRSRRAGAYAAIDVEDNGVGLDNPESVFEPFFTTKANGMGMGLAICRSIAAAHNGMLSVVRNPAYGTTFSFTVPLAADERL
jgi:PAS domain S-box-containing protein